jgi:hypothetical protein
LSFNHPRVRQAKNGKGKKQHRDGKDADETAAFATIYGEFAA